MPNTYTSKFRLAKPEVGVLDWHLYYYDAMDMIDAHVPRIFMSAPLLATISKSAGGSLTQDQYYFYRVAAMNGTDITMASWEDWKEQADATNKTISITWSAVSGATKYRVYRADTSDGSYIPVAGDYNLLAEVTSGTNYDDDGTVVPSGAIPSAPTWATTEILQTSSVGDTTEAQTQHATPANLLENLNNIRYVLDTVIGKTNWDDAPTTNLEWIGSGKAGGQTLTGGTASGEDLTLRSTAHATKGQIIADSELDMTTHKIVNVVDPTNPQEAATKQYVDNYVVSGGWVEYREEFVVGTASGNYTGSTTVFALLNNYVTNGKNLDVFYDGVKMRQGSGYDYLETDGFTVTFNSPRVSGRRVTMEWGRGAAPATVVNEKRENYTATSGQTVFNLTTTFLTGGKNLKVYVDGVLMTITDDYVETDNDTITFTSAMTGGEKVSFLWGDPVADGDAQYLNSIPGSATPAASTYLALDSDSLFPGDILRNPYQRNMIDNGGFDIWQRGTSFTGVNNGEYTVDRWSASKLNCTMDVARSGVRPTAVQSGGEYSTYINCYSLGSTPSCAIGQSIENYKSYMGKKVSLSGWMKTSSNQAGFRLTDTVTDTDVKHSGSDEWEYLTVTITVSSSATALSLAAGFTYDGDAEVDTIYVADVMLVVGPDPVPYIPLSLAEEYNRCQRWYEYGRILWGAVGFSWNGAYGMQQNFHFNSKKHPSPTITASDWVVYEEGGSSGNSEASYAKYMGNSADQGGYLAISKAGSGAKPCQVIAYWYAEST